MTELKTHRIGEKRTNQDGYSLEIIDYIDSNHIKVLIDDKHIVNTKYWHFKNGTIKNIYSNIKNLKFKGSITMPKKKQETLCWSCSNACAKCNWSKFEKPIEGWNAQPTKYKDESDIVESYLVVGCPQYKYDGKFEFKNY